MRLAISAAIAFVTLVPAPPASPPASSNLLVVDDDAPAPFASIQAAVDAAQEGDTLLVRPGTYAGFVVTNKSLLIVGDLGGAVVVQGTIRVLDLAASKVVVLSNLIGSGTDGFDLALTSALDVANNVGSVRVERCVLTGGYYLGRGARVRSCADVSFVDCHLQGGQCNDFSSDGAGIESSEGSIVSVYRSEARGGRGTAVGVCNDPNVDAPFGGNGVRVRDSFLFAGGAYFRGGDGGDSVTSSLFHCLFTGSGGAGIRADNGDVPLLETVRVGGAPGTLTPAPGCGPCGGLGYTGSDQYGSQFHDLPGQARELDATTPVASGSPASITLYGRPGDRVILLLSAAPSPAVWMPEWNGVLLVPNPREGGNARLLQAGTVPANGALQYTLPYAAPGSGSARTFFLQAVFTDSQSVHFLSGARSVTLLPNGV